MDRLRQDLAFAIRLLVRSPVFTATTILTLVLCIGANTAIFAVVRSVLLRPLQYPDADRLVYAYDAFPGAGVQRAGTSIPNYIDRIPMTDVFDSVAVYRFSGFRVGSGQSAEGVASMDVTPSFFRVLRTNAVRGRVFDDADGQIGKNRVAILSHEFAVRLLGSADRAIGRQLRLNDITYTVVGVLPEGFHFLNPEVRIWTPLAFTAEERSEDARHSQNHEMIGRLATGATVERAQSRIDALNVRILELAGALKPLLVDAGYHTRVVPFQADVVRNVQRSLQLLWGGALFVLLIAGVNITNLALVRANGRLRELATRYALGAAQSRVTRQLVTETMLLTLVGGALGLAVGAWSLEPLRTFGFVELPRTHEIRIDGAVVAVILGMACLLGLVIGAVPAAHMARMNLTALLHEEGRAGTASRGARIVRRSLVVAQVALAFILLAVAGLLFASFRHLLAIDPGFKAEHVLTGRVALLESRYPNEAALTSYASRILERLRTVPGVEAVGITTFLPFSFDDSSSVIIPEGYTPVPGESVVSPNRLIVSPGYLEAMAVPLRRGRFFKDSDTATAPRVVILDERLANKFWPGKDPIGRRVYQPTRPDEVAKPGPDAVWLQVVGVVGTVKLKALVEGEASRVGAYYFPFAQEPARGLGLAIRTSGDPSAVTTGVRQALTAIDTEVQPFDVVAMPDRVEQSLNPRKTPMLLSLAFAFVALVLAALGLYGVLAYQVTQRTREIGIRMALGSDARAVLGLIFREGAALVLIGLAVGAAGAVALRRFVASQLYGVGTFDPSVILIVIGVLALAAFAACLGPARRASRVNPVVALSQQ
jgi:putative ABC transport system permease protein